jgi:hypothetical protein
MKKRIYRKVPIKQFHVEQVTDAVSPGRLVFAIDVAKVDMVAAFADQRGEPLRFVSWKNPEQGGTLMALLSGLKARGYQLEAVMVMAAFGEQRDRFDSAAAIQKYLGVAPVTERSGNKHWVHWR